MDHFAILAESGGRWSEVGREPVGSHSAKLSDLHSSAQASALCVIAVGKPSIVNHSSGPVSLPTPQH